MGTVVLVGAGEFLESMRPVDEVLLQKAGGRRVVVLPTASAPDGPGVPERWARMGTEHFRSLGAEVEAVMALDREACLEEGAADLVRSADLVYFSGGKPGYLFQTLTSTPVWSAVLQVLSRGGVLAGCSAGAMILGGYLPDFSGPGGMPVPGRWARAFGVLPDTMVIPHFNEIPRPMRSLFAALGPRDTRVVGIDAGTALAGDAQGWVVLGAGNVAVGRGRRPALFRAGDRVPLPPPALQSAG
jgi:cyanophycinase